MNRLSMTLYVHQVQLLPYVWGNTEIKRQLIFKRKLPKNHFFIDLVFLVCFTRKGGLFFLLFRLFFLFVLNWVFIGNHWMRNIISISDLLFFHFVSPWTAIIIKVQINSFLYKLPAFWQIDIVIIYDICSPLKISDFLLFFFPEFLYAYFCSVSDYPDSSVCFPHAFFCFFGFSFGIRHLPFSVLFFFFSLMKIRP